MVTDACGRAGGACAALGVCKDVARRNGDERGAHCTARNRLARPAPASQALTSQSLRRTQAGPFRAFLEGLESGRLAWRVWVRAGRAERLRGSKPWQKGEERKKRRRKRIAPHRNRTATAPRPQRRAWEPKWGAGRVGSPLTCCADCALRGRHTSMIAESSAESGRAAQRRASGRCRSVIHGATERERKRD